MQSAAAKAIDEFIGSGSKKNLGKSSSSGGQDQVNFSLELWKKAFEDACERLCPVRAGGHECGCLPALARLVKLLHSIFCPFFPMLSSEMERF